MADLKIVEVTAYPTSFPVPEKHRLTLGIGRVVKRDAVVVKVTTDGDSRSSRPTLAPHYGAGEAGARGSIAGARFQPSGDVHRSTGDLNARLGSCCQLRASAFGP
jgi:hypothetical protein